VGSGKSSLLAALLGELHLVGGRVIEHGPGVANDARGGSGVGGVGVAYVQQSPWVMGGTLRDNILLGQAMDPGRYLEVYTCVRSSVCMLACRLSIFCVCLRVHL